MGRLAELREKGANVDKYLELRNQIQHNSFRPEKMKEVQKEMIA